MKTAIIITLTVFISITSFSQTVQEDSVAFNKIKKSCNIIDYGTSPNWLMYFELTGSFIKAYTVLSDDKMLSYTLAISTTDTVFILELKAYGRTWLTSPSGVHGLGSFDTFIDLPDYPITVSFDKQKKLYLYSAKLRCKKPFDSEADRQLGIKIFELFGCDIFKLDIFTTEIKNSDKVQSCIAEINSQMYSLEQRNALKAEQKKRDEEWAPIMEEARRLDKANSKPKTKTKAKVKN